MQNNNDSELESACLDSLSSYIAKLSTGDENTFRHHLKDITDTLKGNLFPEAKLFEITCKILLHITEASQSAARLTAKEILPILTNTYNITKTPAHHVKIFKVLVDFAKILNGIYDENEELQHIPALVVGALVHGDSEMKIAAWNSIGVVKLSENLKQCVFENIRNNIMKPLPVELREALLVCFQILAIKYPVEIKCEIIEKIELNNGVALQLFIEAIGRISTHKPFIEIVFPIIIRYCLGCVGEAEVAFSCLCDILEKQEGNRDVMTYLIESLDAIKQMIKWAVQNEIADKQNLLENVSITFKILVGSLNAQQQEELVATEINEILKQYKVRPNTIHIVLLNGLLLRLHQDVNVGNEVIDTIFAETFGSHYINDMLVQLLANVLNKTKEEAVLCTYLEKISAKCNAEVNCVNVKVISWITKALLMRNYVKTNDWIEKVN